MPHKKNHMAYIPKIGYKTKSRITRGTGAGHLLLDGGKGTGSSYESVSEYQRLTNAPIGGSGLSKSITQKLEKLEVKNLPKSKKPKNIQFSL
jgi:hypothetical protein